MNYQRYFERLINQKITDRTFRRYKALLKAENLPVDRDNLKTLAGLKKLSDRRKISLPLLLKSFLEMPKMPESVQGETLKNYVLGVTKYRPHRTTISRWFPDYSPDRVYSPEETTEIVLLAFTYQYHASNKKRTSANPISNYKAWDKNK